MTTDLFKVYKPNLPYWPHRAHYYPVYAHHPVAGCPYGLWVEIADASTEVHCLFLLHFCLSHLHSLPPLLFFCQKKKEDRPEVSTSRPLHVLSCETSSIKITIQHATSNPEHWCPDAKSRAEQATAILEGDVPIISRSSQYAKQTSLG